MSPAPRISLRPFVLVAALSGLVACVEDNADAGLLILRNIAPGDDCTLDTTTVNFINHGRIQSNSLAGYLFTPLVRNDLVISDNEAEGPKTVFLEGARVEISFYDPTLFTEEQLTDLANRSLTSFVVPVSGSVEPAGGLAALGFEVVPRQLLIEVGNALPAATPENPAPTTVVDARVQMFGSRGGGEIESNWFHYPVEVCVNCLTIDHGECSALPDSFDARTGGVCNPVQDGYVDCCDGGAVCPATSTTEQ